LDLFVFFVPVADRLSKNAIPTHNKKG